MSEISAYYPFGMQHRGSDLRVNESCDYLYNGKELDTDFGLNWYYYGARLYDPSVARFISVDPLAESMSSWSPYNYTFNNPIKFIDPDGRSVTSTIVTENSDGTYSVSGGEADGDTGVYIDDGEGGQGRKIGNSLTPISFLFDDLTPIIDATIDLNSTEGQDLLDGLISDDPSVLKYISNAKGGQDYDFKSKDMPKGLSEEDKQKYRYRGSKLEDGTIVSARDVGNLGAGWVAGKEGMNWTTFRLGADALETKQKTGNYLGLIPPAKRYIGWPATSPYRVEWHTEGRPTVEAQKIGYKRGKALHKARVGHIIPGS